MAHGHEQYANQGFGDPGASSHALHADHGPRVLPANLGAPPVVALWETRTLITAGVGLVLSLIVGLIGGFDHIMRGYLLGFMLCFGFAGGGLCMLMLQYVSGGKWGLILRRPLEAMSRTTPLLVLLFIPLMLFSKRLYLWAIFPTRDAVENGAQRGLLNEADAHALTWKHPMLSPLSVILQFVVIFGFMLLWSYFLNRWSLERDADPAAGTQQSFEFWRIRSENLSGIGILIYVILLTACVFDLVMSLDITWYSTMYGLIYLVGQGYGVLALGVHSIIRLSRYQPLATALRKTEQYDLGKFMLGFVMLNIYLSFSQFLIIWSANQPEEIPWYLHRIRGGWWVITSLDFIFHWVIPFVLLLSRQFKYDNRKMLALTAWMIFARCFDLFWLIEPNFKDAAENLHMSVGILAYITVPLFVVGVWMWLYLRNLTSRPLIVRNDPHTAEILEPEHAH